MAAVPTAESVRCELLAETIRVHGKARLRVQGTSMLPNLWPGDVLHVEHRHAGEVSEGTILLYQREQRLFAHRLLKKEGSGLVTRGDRHARPDPLVRPQELLGEVTQVERAGKTFAPAHRAGPTAVLLRFVSRFSDLPAGLLLRFRGASHALTGFPELVPETTRPAEPAAAL